MSLTPAQAEARKRSIGSTDSAAVLGLYHPEMAHLSKMKNAGDVWLRLVHGIDLPQNSAMGRGVRVEPLLRQLFRDTIGPVDEPPGTLRHPSHEWMVGSPDGLTSGELVEFKTVGRWGASKWGAPGTDLVPDACNLQVQHLMAVADKPVAIVLAAFGSDFKDDAGADAFSVETTGVYLVKRDEVLISRIVECGARFMREHVQTRVAPPLKPLHNIRKWQSILKEQNQPEAENE